jgi:hypothetical protein
VVAAITIAAAVVALLGALLTLRGLRPPRSGDTPYCRKCGYNLTGRDRTAALARCSECGAELAGPRAVILGERHVRRGLTVAGLICLLLGLTPLTVVIVDTVRKVDWYVYKPTRWVLADARNPNATLADRAFQEMNRRRRAGTLTAAQATDWIECCLALQPGAFDNRYGLGYRAADELSALHAAGRLTAEEAQRFFENMVRIRVTARPVVVRGQVCPMSVRAGGRAPEPFAFRARVDNVRVDGRLLKGYEHPTLYGNGGCGCAPRVALSDAGRHIITATVSFEVYRVRGGSDEVDAPASLGGPRTFSVEVNVLEEEPPGLIKLTHTPELDARISRAFSLAATRWDWDSSHKRGPGAIITIDYAGPTGIGLAFDACAEFAGKQVKLGRVTAAPQDRRLAETGPLWIQDSVPDELTVILRSSKAAALEETVDLREIWDGELRFENVPVLEWRKAEDGAPRPGVKAVVRRRSADGATLPAANAQELPPTPH